MAGTFLDWTQFASRLSSYKESHGFSENSKAFAQLCLELILRTDATQASDALTDGGNDRGIDAVHIQDRLAAQPIIHFFQFKCWGEFKKSARNFPSTEIDKLCSFISDLLSKTDDLAETCNPLLANKIDEIYRVIETSHPRFVIHLCSNGERLVESERKRLFSNLFDYGTFDLREYDLKSLADLCLDNQFLPVNARIQLLGKPIDKSDWEIRGIIGTLTAEELVKLIKNPSKPEWVNQNIFHDNIRNFLSFGNEINEKIYKSASSKENYRFWYLNNGITITCDGVNYQKGLSNPHIELVNAQIVNGLQTSHAIFEAYNLNRDAVKDVQVLVRIYEIKAKDIASKIAEATNSQTRIYSRDLRSNDEIQKKIEDALQNLGFFYERKKGSHNTKPPEARIDSLKFGQVCLAYFLEEPSKAKVNSDEIFDSYYDEIFNERLDLEEALAAYRTFLQIESIKDRITDEMRSLSGRNHIHSFISYATFHVLYAAKMIAQERQIQIKNISADDRELLIREALGIVSEVVKAAQGVSFYELFRAPRSKNEIVRRVFSPQLQLFDLNQS